VYEDPVIDLDRLGDAVKRVLHRGEQVVGVPASAVSEQPAASDAEGSGGSEVSP
jgi:hypothetical protein